MYVRPLAYLNKLLSCKKSRFKPPFGRLSRNAQGSSMAQWKAHYRLPISDN